MKLDYMMPTARLSGAMSIVGHIHALDAPVGDVVPALLPNLHIRIAGTSRYAFRDGAWVAAPPVAIVGATSAAFRMEMSADFEMVCVGFLPEGWRDCVRLPCADLADAMVDAGAIWPACVVDALRTAVAEARDLTARRAIVEAFLTDRAHAPARGDAPHVRAIRRWLERPGALSLDVLGAELDRSPRQIARLTLDAFGASPKTLAMKYRALRAAGAMTVRGRDGLDDALTGYADQSHLIRDFHRFVGWTPGHFLADRRPLARATMQGRWNAGARSPLVLCS